MSLVNLSRSALVLLLAASNFAGVNAFPAASDVAAAATQGPAGKVSTGYFAGYHAKRKGVTFGVDQIPWDKYDDVKYAFAETTADGSLDLSKSAPEELPKFVDAAHAHGKKAQVALGGWAGSIHFSSNVGSPENRTAFVKTCLDLVQKYNLDGLDFDWEYPNKQGLGCNAISPNDTANFISFLTELRKAQPKPLLLTAAVSLYPYNDAAGQQSANGALKPMGDLLDYSIIMGYDVFGAWAPTGGPNAPLEQACDPRNNQGGIKEGVAKWVAAGVPAEKLILGIGAYGHGFTVSQADAFVPTTDGKPFPLSAYPRTTAPAARAAAGTTTPPSTPAVPPSPPVAPLPFGAWSPRASSWTRAASRALVLPMDMTTAARRPLSTTTPPAGGSRTTTASPSASRASTSPTTSSPAFRSGSWAATTRTLSSMPCADPLVCRLGNVEVYLE
ncbi:hypothetical protein MCOR02_010574 [Pyricularia oryzae]|nr:hypothetical protein MCOR02_010574 [Pyricularia oryzae]